MCSTGTYSVRQHRPPGTRKDSAGKTVSRCNGLCEVCGARLCCVVIALIREGLSKKSRIRETLNLLECADSSTNANFSFEDISTKDP